MADPAKLVVTDLTWHHGEVDRAQRWAALGGAGATVWFTGLSGSGKSTVAALVERLLIQSGRPAYVLDGDNLRHGLNSDLGFSAADRAENVRRTAHAAALLAEAGTVAVVSLVSPYARDRDAARALHAAGGLPLVEVWVDTPLAECERRDPKRLYARARAGEITGMTGLDDPYEAPIVPEVTVRGAQEGVGEAVERIMVALRAAASGT